MQEAQNVFQRAKARPSLAEDRTNRFERHDAARTEQKKVEHEADVSRRVARNAEQRRSWVGDGRKQNSAVGSTTLNSDLVELKRASDASREAARQPLAPTQPALTLQTVEAVIAQFEQHHPDYYSSRFNDTNFWNAIAAMLHQGHAFSYEVCVEVYKQLKANNFLESKPGPRKRGEFVLRSAPQVYYPHHVAEREREELAQDQEETRRANDAADGERAKSMPFEQLRRLAQATFKFTEDAAVRARSLAEVL